MQTLLEHPASVNCVKPVVMPRREDTTPGEQGANQSAAAPQPFRQEPTTPCGQPPALHETGMLAH